MRAPLGPAGDRALALVALLVFALAAVVLPWFALDGYVASGWQATWWARVAVVLAAAAALLLRVGGPAHRPAAAALAAAALVLVAVRALLPPDFGFDFGGLEVPTERRFGLWVALAAAALAALGAARRREAAGASRAPGA